MRRDLLPLEQSLTGQLLGFPSLAARAQTAPAHFATDVLAWIETAEQVLLMAGNPRAASLASLRLEIETADPGEQSRAKRRRARTAAAGAAASEAERILQDALAPLTAKLSEVRELLLQVATAVVDSGLIPDADKMDRARYAETVWASISAHEQLKEVAAHARAAVSEADVLGLLEELLVE